MAGREGKHLKANIPPHIENLLRQHLSSGMPANSALTLHSRSNKRGGLLRLPLEDGGSVVVKVWHLRNMKERIKSMMRISNGWREWRMHRLIHQVGIPTPEPLWCCRLKLTSGEQIEVMGVEDLGKTESGVPYLTRLSQEGREEKITWFENAVIDVTAKLLKQEILDVDNQINNYIVDSKNHVIRIDFECARQRCFIALRKVEYATMLDRLLRSHIHATHPENDRSRCFMSRLATELSVSPEILNRSAAMTRKALSQERKKTGIDYGRAF